MDRITAGVISKVHEAGLPNMELESSVEGSSATFHSVTDSRVTVTRYTGTDTGNTDFSTGILVCSRVTRGVQPSLI